MISSFNKDVRKRRSKSLGDTLLTQKKIKSSLAQMPKGCLKSPSRSMLEDNDNLDFGITMSEKKKRRRSVGRRVSFASKTRVRVFEKNSKFSTPQTRKSKFNDDDGSEFRFADNNDSPLKLQNLSSIPKLSYKENYIDQHGVINFDSDSDRQNSNLSSDNSESHLLDNENREEIITEIMDRIASKNEKLEANSLSTKYNEKFREKNEFNTLDMLNNKNKNNTIHVIDEDTLEHNSEELFNKENEKENKNTNNSNDNDSEVNNKKEDEKAKKNENDNEGENDNTNESENDKSDISGIIVGADNDNYNANNQKSVTTRVRRKNG